MGECGCGSFYPNFKFKGPGKDTYVLQIYPSCNDCNTPAGVVLYRMSPKEARQWDLEDVPEKEIPFIGMAVPVIDPEVFKELGLKLFLGDDLAQQVVEDAIGSCFKPAALETERRSRRH